MHRRKTLVISMLGFVLLALVIGMRSVAAVSDAPDKPAVVSATVPLGSIKDNTLFEESGSLSNGKGEYFFAGRTGQANSRRGLVRFDIASNVPPNALVISATLRLHLSKYSLFQHEPEPFSIHRVLTEWGEGTSDAPGEEGTGTTATKGDATWLFARYSPTPTERINWTTPGGDFAPQASASTMADVNGYYYWGSSPGIIADLMHWLRFPDNNHGWLLVGDEDNNYSARRFDSRENGNPSMRPVLYVEYVAARQSYLPVIIGD